jgi:23S rRNA (adenine2030-N6)-methyltransferase
MNYRHAFHAGNFADVWKHLALVFCLDHLAQKEAAFRVLDVFAGIGTYRLDSEAAQRSPEWRDGIARVMDCVDPPPAVARYREAMLAAGDGPSTYPGSPAFIINALRPQDKAHFCELHEADFETLRENFGAVSRIKIERRDGWAAVRALLPPIERRGLVLIDPPFEQAGEFDRLVTALEDGLKRWAHGCFILWHADKDAFVVRQYRDTLAASGARLLAADLHVAAPHESGGLVGCGLTIANPPFGLEAALQAAGDYLAALLARGNGHKAHITRICGHW